MDESEGAASGRRTPLRENSAHLEELSQFIGIGAEFEQELIQNLLPFFEHAEEQVFVDRAVDVQHQLRSTNGPIDCDIHRSTARDVPADRALEGEALSDHFQCLDRLAEVDLVVALLEGLLDRTFGVQHPHKQVGGGELRVMKRSCMAFAIADGSVNIFHGLR